MLWLALLLFTNCREHAQTNRKASLNSHKLICPTSALDSGEMYMGSLLETKVVIIIIIIDGLGRDGLHQGSQEPVLDDFLFWKMRR